MLPEPVHLDLVLEDETVVNAIPQIGFVHRGLEKLVETRDYQRYVFVAERVCGICSFGHSCGYSQAVEQLMDIEVPRRAQYLRVIWHELSRIHSHLLWLGLAADAMGFESAVHAQLASARARSRHLRKDHRRPRHPLRCATPGGVFKDIEDTELQGHRRTCSPACATSIDQIAAMRSLSDGSVRKPPARAWGILTPEDGPRSTMHAWAPSRARPTRTYAMDVRLVRRAVPTASLSNFEPVTRRPRATATPAARCASSRGAASPSTSSTRWSRKHPATDDIAHPRQGHTPPTGAEGVQRAWSSPAASAFYYVRGNGSKYLERFRVRTPTSANIPGMVGAIAGCDLADVPNIILTIDPCISCSER